MSNRPLGPWVWCRYCRRYGLGGDDGTCLSPYRDVIGRYQREQVRHIKGASLREVGRKGWTRTEQPLIAAWPCAPRLTLIGHIRRILGMQIGEES